jgi:hypothetical protein
VIPTNISGKKKYWLRAIGDNNTPIDSSTSFQLIQGPDVHIGADTSFCDGESFTLTLDAGSGFVSYLWSDNSTAQTLNVSAFGNYSVQVDNSDGCSANDELIITKDMNPNVASTEITSPTCVGNDDGSISIVVVSGTAPYSYIWSNGMTVEDISGLSSGVYQVTITDTKECKYVRSETLSPPVPISSTMLLTDVKCFSGNDGIVDLSVSGGKSPYTYAWSNGKTNQDLSGLTAGTYYVSIKDDNNCVQLDTAVIAEPLLLQIAISPSNLTCNGSNDGSIDVTVSGGTTGYLYAWSNGATSQDLSALSANAYHVTVTDFNNCMASVSTTLTEPPSLNASVTSKNVSCNAGNDGSLDLTPSGGTSPYTYLWSNGATSEDIMALFAGTYDLTLTDANNCQLSTSGTVTEPTALALSAISADVKCFGGNNGSVSLSISGGTSPYKYIWNNASTTKDLSGLIKGTYAVTVTDDNNCSIQASSVVNEPTLLVLSHTSINVQCNAGNDGSIDLSVSGATPGYTYKWSNGSTSQDVSTLVKGTYSVTVTDANLCSETRTINITEPTALNLSKSLNHVQCKNGNDGSINITPSGGTTPYKYLWSNGATSQDLIGLKAGTYSVTLTDNQSCVLTDISVITEPTALTASITPSDVKCKNGNDGSIDVTIGGGSLPYTYKWSNGASTEDISNLVDGTYTLTITDDHGCFLVRSANVNEPTALTSSISGTDVLCNGGVDGKADLTVGGGTSSYTYKWSNGSATEDLSGVKAGIYAVTITDNNACTKTDQIVIAEPSALAKSSVLTHVLCNAGTNGAIDLSISGGTSPYIYTWSNGATSEDLTNLSAGTYMVTVTDDHNCVIMDTSVITQPTVLALSKIVKDVLCYGGSDGSVDITVSGGVGPYTYQWSNGSGSEDVSNLILGNYVVTVTDANKCFLIDNNAVGQPLSPLSSSILVDSVNCFGENTGSVSINVSGGTSGYNYFWSNGSTSQSISSLYKGRFTVVVRDQNNCFLYDTANVYEPNVLTASFNPSDVLCYGGNSGSIDMTVSGGTMSYSYIWSNGSGLEDISNLTIGTYSVTITDINSCIYIDSAEIREPLAPLSSGVLITDVKCFDGSDGAVDLNVNGGTVPYKFSWTNGETSQSIGGLKSGEYRVLIVDFNNCELRDTGLVNQPLVALGLSEVISDVKCFGGADGAVDITPNGGTPPYNFSWSDGTSGEDISGKSTGTYYLTLSDFNNCIFLDTFFINQPLAPLSTNITAAEVQCFGGNDGSLDLDVSGGTFPYAFSWSNSSIAEDINSLTTGSYDVLVTDANNCTIRDTAFVSQPAAPLDVVFTVTDVKCFGGNDGALDIQVTGGTGPYGFAWSTTSTNEDIQNLISNWYTVVITDAQNCVLTDSAFVFEPTVLKTVSASTTATADGANGKAWTLPEGGTSPYNYLWDDALAQKSDTAKNLIIGAYLVVVTDDNGCIVKDSIFVHLAPETSTIVMYPNPTTGSVTIANLDALGLDEPITIELIQLQGKTEQTFEVIGLSEFSFALDQNLFNGPYIVRISNFRGTVQRKLVLIR